MPAGLRHSFQRPGLVRHVGAEQAAHQQAGRRAARVAESGEEGGVVMALLCCVVFRFVVLIVLLFARNCYAILFNRFALAVNSH
jgi:hypothetical protein